MHKFLTQILAYSFILLGIISCKSFELTNASKVENTTKSVENNYFSSPEDYLYKCHMEVYGNDISGILVMKKIDEKTHRVVMTTDFGNKMIDFEISENNFKLNYVLADLDKKMVINFLKNDFQLLLKKNFSVQEKLENKDSTIFVSNEDKNTYYLYFNKDSKLLQQLIYTKNKKEKIDFNFEAKNPIFADKIVLQHKDYKIRIELTQITKEN
jgi:hypothetical protein